jgi:hypothetical protein
MPAIPAPARNNVRRLNEKRLVGAGIGDPPKLAFFVSGLRTGRQDGQSGDKLTA